MSFGEAIRSGFSNFVLFRGRATRSEFWWFYLFAVLVSVALNIIDTVLGWRIGASTQDIVIGDQVVPLVNYGYGVLATIWGLVVLLPLLGLMIRRLHDTDRTGWWLLIGILLSCLCFVGTILLIVFWALPGTAGDNRYGPPRIVA